MNAVAPFLMPPGFGPPPVRAILRETRMVGELGRYLAHSWTQRRERRSQPYAAGRPGRSVDPVLLVPGFMAGDGSLGLLARRLRDDGLRTYSSRLHVNAGCTRTAADALERRLETIAAQRGRRVQIVGHSLGGMLGRGVAASRPDLVSRVITMGSPTLAPAAHHAGLAAWLEVLVRLSAAGVAGVMTAECVAGDCARTSYELARAPLPDEVALTSIWSPHDGIVDYRACRDPQAAWIEVASSHTGMAVDPRVHDHVLETLRS